MKKLLLFALGTVFLLSTALPLSAASRLEKDMVTFDKAYITALALTSQTNKTAAEKAMKLTVAEWAVFKKNHVKTFNKNKSDKADLAKIDQLISNAERIVQANEKTDEAHEVLEGVRNTFLKIRERNSIVYYIDYTTKFHEPMEAVVLTVKGKTAETLTEEMLLKIKDNFKVAEQDWENLQKASFDPVLFSFTAEKETQRLGYIKAETEAMNKLKKALEGDDKETIIKASMGIKSNFVKLFLMFGDFEKIK